MGCFPGAVMCSFAELFVWLLLGWIVWFRLLPQSETGQAFFIMTLGETPCQMLIDSRTFSAPG